MKCACMYKFFSNDNGVLAVYACLFTVLCFLSFRLDNDNGGRGGRLQFVGEEKIKC